MSVCMYGHINIFHFTLYEGHSGWKERQKMEPGNKRRKK